MMSETNGAQQVTAFGVMAAVAQKARIASVASDRQVQASQVSLALVRPGLICDRRLVPGGAMLSLDPTCWDQQRHRYRAEAASLRRSTPPTSMQKLQDLDAIMRCCCGSGARASPNCHTSHAAASPSLSPLSQLRSRYRRHWRLRWRLQMYGLAWARQSSHAGPVQDPRRAR